MILIQPAVILPIFKNDSEDDDEDQSGSEADD